MAGLIQDQLKQQAPGEPDGDEMQAMPTGGAPAGAQDPESNSAYQQAVAFAMEALYTNKAAKQVAQSLKGARSPAEGLANTAYEITSIIDEKTDGQVPDEFLAPLAAKILEEVADIAEAAGVTVTGADIAEAMKTMILRFLGEQGVDTTQLEQAMNQINPEEFNKVAAEEA